MKKAIIYKTEGWRSGIEFFVGVVESKKKTYKIRAMDSGLFNGYKVFVKEEDVVCEFDVEEKDMKKIKKALAKVKQAKEMRSEYLEKLKTLKQETRDSMLKIADEIKDILKN